MLPMMAASKNTAANPISSGQTDASGEGVAGGSGVGLEVGRGV